MMATARKVGCSEAKPGSATSCIPVVLPQGVFPWKRRAWEELEGTITVGKAIPTAHLTSVHYPDRCFMGLTGRLTAFVSVTTMAIVEAWIQAVRYGGCRDEWKGSRPCQAV